MPTAAPAPTTIRDTDAGRDAPACAAIYAPYVVGTVASFEYEPPSAEEMRGRMAGAHLWLMAERDGVPVGYAYASRHHERAAYDWAANVAVYIDAGHHGSGVGRALYTELLARMRAAGYWTLCAGITLPNAGSTGLHGAFGFVPVGTYRRIGWKAGAWHDVEWWQLNLRPGEAGEPGALAG